LNYHPESEEAQGFLWRAINVCSPLRESPFPQLALRTVLDDGWHTYWRNPGDSGEPVQLSWNLPEGWAIGDIVWPLPLTIPTGPIINYGFEGAPLFPVDVTVPANAAIGSVQTLNLDFYYLVCKDVCIPEDGSASIDIMIGESVTDTRWDALISNAIATAPKPGTVFCKF